MDSSNHRRVRCRRKGLSGFASTIVCFVWLCPAFAAEKEAIALVETYGLHSVAREAVLAAAAVKPGDAVPEPAQVESIIEKLKGIPGVEQASAKVILTPRANGPAQAILYLGIQEAGRPSVKFRDAPEDESELPSSVVETYREFERTLEASVRAGDFSEDDTNGYALMGNAAARAVQKRFVPLANEHERRLLDVLHTARNAEQRAMAALILGYASDRQRVAEALAAAARDPNETVRNNAMRGLGVLLGYAKSHPEHKLDVPTDWLLDMLESIHWTDRNKALSVLIAAPTGGDNAVVNKLRTRSVPTLGEMARWNSEGHALMPFLLLGRVVGMRDAEVFQAWNTGKREEVISRALQAASPDENKTE
jgi:hypothetical protein